jgi:hypothetical protein
VNFDQVIHIEYLLSLSFFFSTESENNLETIRQSYLNTIDELNREILALKEQFVINHQESHLQTNGNLSESSPSNEINQELPNVISISNEDNMKENDLEHVNQQLQEENLVLQNQCTQFDNANRAWQQFYDNQLNFLKNQFKDYLDFDKDLNFDQIIRTIATELEKQIHSSGKIQLN